MTHQRHSIGARLLAALLRLLPGDFRGDFGDAMSADFDERSRDARARVWRREVPSLLVTAVREHLSVLKRDVFYAFRTMGRTPGFTALAILMLAIGTGTNVAMFTVIDAVMLRSPFPDPDRLVMVQVREGKGAVIGRVTPERFEELAASPRSLAAVGALSAGGSPLWTGRGDPRRLDMECVSSAMFDVLGTRPLIGRTFTPAEDRPGTEPTVVLSFQFWKELGGQPELVGTPLTLNHTPVTVIGVMPRGFAGPYSRSDTQGWLPHGATLISQGLTGCTPSLGIHPFARVRAPLTLQEAEAALPGFKLVSLQGAIFDDVRTPFSILAAAVSCVLLIACLNVGGLQLERAVARRREMALRMALGASRGRLVRQTLTENLVLALAGALAGLMATVVTVRALVSILPPNIPHLDEIEVNARVVIAAMLAAAVAGLIAGIIPVLQTRHFSAAKDLNEGGRGATRRNEWTRRTFVVAEIALSIVMLIGAGLMIQTFMTLRFTRPGFEPAGKLATIVRLPGAAPHASAEFFERLIDRARTIPGVRGATTSSYLPVTSTVSVNNVTYQGTKSNAFGAAIRPDYFELMKIPVIAGRPFNASDSAQAAPVMIVNEIFARRLRPDGAVVGQVVVAESPRIAGARPLERLIVGVIANTRTSGADTRARTEYYVPFAQNVISMQHFIVDADPRYHVAVSSGIRQALRELKPDLVIEPISPLTTMLDRRGGTKHLGAWLLGIFAAMAVGLAGTGLMMTIGWWVSQRTRELGVRVALGASRVQLMQLVFRQGLSLGVIGIAVGCAAAVGVTRYLEGWIYGISPLDPPTFAFAAVLMFVVASCAIYVPTRRAVSVDPAITLRVE